MSPQSVTVRRPQRWDQPLDPNVSDADVQFLMRMPPFSNMDQASFPKSTPLEGIIRNDMRLHRLDIGRIAVRQGDYGQSAYLVLDGQMIATAEGTTASQAARPHVSWWSEVVRVWRRSRLAEVRTPTQVSGNAVVEQGDSNTTNTNPDVVPRPGVSMSVQGFDAGFVDGAARLGKGEMFGEVAAMYRIPEAATVVAVEPATVLEIRWQGLRILQRDRDFADGLEQHYRDHWLLKHLREVPLFRHVPDDALRRAGEQVSLRSYGRNEWNAEYRKTRRLPMQQQIATEPLVCVEGNSPTDLIIVRSGFGRLCRSHGASDRTTAYLGKGDLFGLREIAASLVEKNPQPRTYQNSLRAVGFLDTLQIPVEVFAKELLPFVRWSELPVDADDRRPSRIQRRHHRDTESSGPTDDEGTSTGEEFESTALLEFIVQHRFNNGRDAMVIDLHRCTRCDKCVEACAASHDGNPRFSRTGPTHGRLQITQACMQCEDPVCLVGCPTGAIARDNATGVIEINEPTCIGCGVCSVACPYQNIAMAAVQDAAGRPFTDVDKGKPITKATKCDSCSGALAGPACVNACPHDAIVRLDLTQSEPLQSWLAGREDQS